MPVLGIDIGAATAKAVILEGGRVLSAVVIPTGFDVVKTAGEVTALARDKVGCLMEDLGYCVATGYARNIVPFADKTITEITCQAKGIHKLYTGARTIIDIGGQDSKVIRVNGLGNVVNFAMNDKCAAGTGRFLEVMATIFGLKVSEMGEISLRSGSPCQISSTCTVFAETEVVSLRAQGKSREDLISGIHKAMVLRLMTMIRMLGYERQVVLTGGVAKNTGVRKYIEDEIKFEVEVPEEPQVTAALGAALFAEDEIGK